MSKYIGVEQNDTELQIYSMGYEDNGELAHWGPGVRKHYVLHYVVEGRGFFNGSPVHKGEGFLICPNKLHEYHADSNSPWKYYWLIFDGIHIRDILNDVGIRVSPHIFKYAFIDKISGYVPLIFSEGVHIVSNNFAKGWFFILMSNHQNNETESKKISLKQQRVQAAIDFIKTNFHRKIKITDVSNHIFIDSQYMYNIFMECKGVSPKEYLNNLRIEHACKLLKNTAFSISQIAESVGYDDSLQFSKFFKSQKNISPKLYRKQQENS